MKTTTSSKPVLKNICREVIVGESLYSVEKTGRGFVLWIEYGCPTRLARRGETLRPAAPCGVSSEVFAALNTPARHLPIPAHYAWR